MSGPTDLDGKIEHWLARLREGDPSAREALINYSCERLRHMTHRMLGDFPIVQRWEQTDDILQRASLRLYRALQDAHPANLGGFLGLAATQIRRELIDLARHYGGPEGLASHHATDAVPPNAGTGLPPRYEQADPTAGPATLQLWTEFHQHVEKLPDAEREVFQLLFYDELPQAEVAEILGIDVRTVKRRWRAAKLLLHEALGGLLPP